MTRSTRFPRKGVGRPFLVRDLRAALAAAVLGILPACQEGGQPLGPEVGARPELHGNLAGFSTDGLIALLQAPDLSASRAAGAWISAAEGGTVSLGGYRVEIPAGALAEDTFITIDLPTRLPEAGYVVAEFGPSGTRFAEPVQITLPLRDADLAGIDLSSVHVGYWDGAKWQDYGGVATSSAVVATTDHFSKYGAGARSGGIDTTSGG